MSCQNCEKLERNHHPLCNSSHRHPIGAVGVTCSCRVVHNSEWRELTAERDQLKAEVEKWRDECTVLEDGDHKNHMRYEELEAERDLLKKQSYLASNILKDMMRVSHHTIAEEDWRIKEALTQLNGEGGKK